MNESALVLYKDDLIVATVGNPSRVEFPFEIIWAYKKSCTLFNPAYLKFYHTHPVGFSEYSEMDVNCLKGLNIAFDFPVYFSILCGNEHTEVYDQVSYIYYKKMVEVENITLWNSYLDLLNYLSEGKIIL